ncbi:syntaxin-like [Atheta coriaria]|uniref:syntaxin-like n=1 Tax=Dalotia coriaria TaxID=877792 RepID=UPI0031F3A576
MPKNRYDELQQEISKNDKVKSKKNKNRDTKLEMEEQENTFENFEVIRSRIDELEENTKKCEAAYRKSASSKGISKKLKDVFKESESLAHLIAKSLKENNLNLKSSENKTCAEYRMKLVQYTGLVERFKIVAGEHQAWAQQICQSEKNFIAKCHQIVNHDELDDSQLNQLIEENPHIFTQDYIQNELEARSQLANLEARHEQLVTIEEHLVEIRDLFVNLATLVELQQDSLNRVEFFAVQATDHIDKAVDELQKAKKNKKRGLIIKICIGIFLLLLVIVILASIFG